MLAGKVVLWASLAEAATSLGNIPTESCNLLWLYLSPPMPVVLRSLEAAISLEGDAGPKMPVKL